MKKILLSLTALAALAFAGNVPVDKSDKFRVSTSDISYMYSTKQARCLPTNTEDRSQLVYALRNGGAVIDEKYINPMGTTYLISFLTTRGDEKQAILMNSYEECRTYLRIRGY